MAAVALVMAGEGPLVVENDKFDKYSNFSVNRN